MVPPPKPFLKKRSGISGRLMENIHYPKYVNAAERVSTPSNISSNTQSSAGENEVQDLNRPYTAGTADSGCPEDGGSVVLSPNSNTNDDGVESVIVDVTDCSGINSAISSEIRSNRGVPSVIRDVSSFSTDETNIASVTLRNFDDDDHIVQKIGSSIAGNLEPHLHDVISPETSENSQDTDGTRSRHWRQVIREFASEAKQKPELLSLESVSAKGGSSSAASSKESEWFSKEIPNFMNCHRRSQKGKLSCAKDTSKVTCSTGNITKKDGIYAHVKKVGNNAEKMNTVLLETSLENLVPGHISEEKKIQQNVDINMMERNLAKQLRDLIAHVDLARDYRHHEYERLEEIFDQALQEKEYFCQQVKELKKRVVQLEEDKQARQENLAVREEAEKIRSADFERLKRENAILNRQQKQKDGSDTALINLLKEQISDLRVMVRDFDRQRSELRTQIRKSNAVLKEKNDTIEQLKGEKIRLEKRIAIITKNKAALRGRLAENTFSTQAITRASNNAPVTTSTKDFTSHNDEFFITSAVDNGRHISQNAPSKVQNTVNIAENTDTLSDNEDAVVVEQGITSARLGKNVRWNEPLTTMASFSPSLSAHPPLNVANSDMHLILTENNMVGRASLYQSEKDFTVYTRTHCGCHFYEYSNTDTRWIHSSKLYQINYYGQAGATTVEICGGKLLVRHFLTGQLEIYRGSGETTLMTSDGRRIEVIRDKSGSVRVEIYELDGRVRVKGRDEAETVHRATQTSCHRMDGSYASHIASDDSMEWRSPDYTVHRFKNGDTKMRLNLIDTSITMLVMDVGTVKHLSKPLDRRLPKYCVEWGTVARKRSRVFAANQSRVLNQL
uniref:Coiled-coil domain-containing protein 186 n=1 Tax=Elaeophora elaphi TaxID=1147741 RepID=A0A158Q7S1_9BILA